MSLPLSQTPRAQCILVDFDSTLAEHLQRYNDPSICGAPIPLMLARVKEWVAKGYTVRIFTARVSPHFDTTYAPRAREAITQWCIEHVGCPLEVTCVKSWDVTQIWDDRAIGLIADTGRRADGRTDDILIR